MNQRTRLLLGGVLAGSVALSIGCGSSASLGPVADSAAAMRIRNAIGQETGGETGDDTAAPTGTGWATLRGRFIYDGTPPAMPPYNVTKDPLTCAPGGSAPLQETLVVDSATGGIKNIAVYLRKASRVHDSAQAGGEPVEFDQKTCHFQSHVLPLTVGQSLVLKNSDNVGHNTNIAGKSLKLNPIIAAGSSTTVVPQREESSPALVTCSIHPWMLAYIFPRDNGYVAVTGDDGSYEIANLPAGEELEIQVWHESATGSGHGLVLTSPEAKQLNWTRKGRFTITLEPDSERELEFVVPATAFGI